MTFQLAEVFPISDDLIAALCSKLHSVRADLDQAKLEAFERIPSCRARLATAIAEGDGVLASLWAQTIVSLTRQAGELAS
jgi:hypothetical protein